MRNPQIALQSAIQPDFDMNPTILGNLESEIGIAEF
jgi:hypothetical protein